MTPPGGPMAYFWTKAQNVVHFSLEFFNLTQYLVLADSILIRFFLVA
jgi:hypothetical protein